MKKQFVQTGNYKRFRAGITAVEARGAAEASLMLVTSQAGYGKSATLEYWATQTHATFMRAKVQWTPRYFLTELADRLGVSSNGITKEVFSAVSLELAKHGTPLVIDEINHCLGRGAAVLEAIRDLSDLTEVIVVIAGHEDVQGKIARYPQIRSRVAQVVRFEPATPADIRLLADQLLDVKIADDLIVEIQRQSAGRTREIMNALAHCEQFAQRNGAKTLNAKDLAGNRLVFDWQPPRAGARVPAGV
ncbi:MAG: AAA family ATPase [Burkholderiales bacterium]|nr:AAA family ATPase [Burkholderiales bacterium]